MKTYILLDNDGVTNAFGQLQNLRGKKSSESTGLTSSNWVSKEVDGYIIQYNTDVIDALNVFLLAENVELVVLSTWEHLSITNYYPDLGIQAPEGTKVLENLYEDLELGGGWYTKWWKLLAVEKFCEDIEEGSRIIWVDDDHYFYKNSVVEYIEKQLSVEFLIVSPEPLTGLTQENLNTMRKFINEPENTGVKRIV